MAKDFFVGIAIGASMQAGMGAVFGRTTKYLAGLGGAIKANEQRASRIEAYRTLETRLGKTRAAAREATERVAKLGIAMRKTAAPSKAMQKELGQARREAQRLTDSVTKQTRALGERRVALRRAKEDIRDLARRERELGAVLAKQRRLRDRLTDSLARQQAASQRRDATRARLIDAVALGYPLARGISATIGAAVRFESVMADVRKVVDFETPTQFEGMGRAVLELSTRLPVAATGIGEIVAAAGQAGIARHELLRFTEDAAKMAVAFDMSAGDAGSAMTGLRTIFKLNQGQAMDLAGAYNHLSNNMDATAADMLRVANRAGPTAQQMFRLTGQELGALGATFLALKTPPEVAGTAINAMLTKLATADEQGGKFRDALDEIGMSAEDLREAIERDGQGALLAFLEAIEQADDKQSVLFNLFGQEYVDDIAKLTGGLDLYRKALGLSSSEQANASSVLDEYAARAATTENNLQLLRNRMERMRVNIGTAFLPLVNRLASAFGVVTDKIAVFTERFPGLTQLVTGVGVGLVGFRVAAIGAGYAGTFLRESLEPVRRLAIRLGAALPSLATGLRGLGGGAVSGARTARTAFATFAGAVRSPRQAIRGLGAALVSLRTAAIPAAVRGLGALRIALVSTGVGAAVVAIGLAAALLIKYWEPVTAFFAGMWRGIVSALQPLREAFAWLAPVGEWIGKIFGQLFGPIQTSTEDMERFGATGERVGEMIGAAFRVLVTPVAKVAEGIGWVMKKFNVFGDEEDEEPATSVSRAPFRRDVIPAATLGLGALAAGPAPAAIIPAPSAPPAVVIPAPPTLPSAPVFPLVAPADVDTSEFVRAMADWQGAQQSPAATIAPRGPTTITITVGDVVIQTPADADPAAIAEMVRREMAVIMREGAIEAGLAEADDAY